MEPTMNDHEFPKMRLGSLLINQGLIQEDQLDFALQEKAMEESVKLGEVLVSWGLITRQELASSLNQQICLNADIHPAVQSRFKRMTDVVGACVGLALSAPLLPVIALAIKLTDGGSIFFTQMRVGLNGDEFQIWKFRTMAVDAEQRLAQLEAQNEANSGVLFTIKSDPRVTAIGKFLRKTHLDELPQFWNVLKGEMSLVGPRPLQRRDDERAMLNDAVGRKRRLMARPGMTGPWQVQPERHTLSFDQVQALDIEYLRCWKPMLDIKLILQTLAVLFSRSH
jgi:lipopolysaccharide/colanic/teichoic acid biosynthesis glycosyltransferase